MNTANTNAMPDSEQTNGVMPPKRSSGAVRATAIIAFIVLVLVVAAFWYVSTNDDVSLAWMAWTKPTAIFFITILCLLLAMCVWEIFRPGGGPRVGILRFETTRGDRLFLSLLGSAFIHLGWLGFIGPDLWKALGVSVVYAILVFLIV